MELNFLPIINNDGKKMQICEDIELVSSSADSFRFLSPAHVSGFAQNIGGTIELYASANVSAEFICDRCAESFERVIEFDIEDKFKKEDEFSSDEKNPDITILGGTSIDFDELVYESFYMNLPSKLLCSDDCKGLCPICGKNINHGECGCKTETTDPRFDILDKLL